jgi:hypothetical protein
MTPITVLFGPRWSFLLFLTLGMAATGVAWYFVLSRVLVGARGPAWLGAAFCAFAPAMVSHANAHPNIVSQFVVPLIVWRTLRLAEPGRWLRNGVLLGLVIVWQAFLNLEPAPAPRLMVHPAALGILRDIGVDQEHLLALDHGVALGD